MLPPTCWKVGTWEQTGSNGRQVRASTSSELRWCVLGGERLDGQPRSRSRRGQQRTTPPNPDVGCSRDRLRNPPTEHVGEAGRGLADSGAARRGPVDNVPVQHRVERTYIVHCPIDQISDRHDLPTPTDSVMDASCVGCQTSITESGVRSGSGARACQAGARRPTQALHPTAASRIAPGATPPTTLIGSVGTLAAAIATPTSPQCSSERRAPRRSTP